MTGFVCDQCGKRITGTPHETATSRRLCDDCNDRLLGASAGVIAGGGVGEAIATAGSLDRIRKAARRTGQPRSECVTRRHPPALVGVPVRQG